MNKPASNAPLPRRDKTRQATAFVVTIAGFLAIALAVSVIAFSVKVRHLNTELADTKKQLAQVQGDNAKTKADLDRAKSATSELQGELTKAQADLKDQQEMAKVAATQQQAQLERAKGSSTELLTQIETEKGHAKETQAQLEKANANATELQTQLNQSKIQVLDLQARLQKAETDLTELQPLLMKTGHLPVSTAVEKSQRGRTFVLHISNQYLQPLSIDVAVAGGKPLSQHFTIGSGATQDVDQLSAGQNVTITSQGYDPVKLTVQ